MKPAKTIFLLALGILSAFGLLTSCTGNQTVKDLQKAIDRCNEGLKNAKPQYPELAEYMSGYREDRKTIKMALRRDSCYNIPEVEALLPQAAEVIKREYKLCIYERWPAASRQNPLNHDNNKYRAGAIIELGNKSLPFIYNLQELDDLQFYIDSALRFLMGNPEYSQSERNIIEIGLEERQRYQDRRIEILSGNLYHSNLFFEIHYGLKGF